MLMHYDVDRSEDRQSEEVQSAYRRDSDIGEEMIISSEEQNDENEWSWVNQDRDGGPLAESVSSLHMTQQVLENVTQYRHCIFPVLRKLEFHGVPGLLAERYKNYQNLAKNLRRRNPLLVTKTKM
uniref:Uncharacterized protein n=1 Tax=Zea mays TaxID=4577 RepID=A0A804RJQ8_MAIZE